MLQSCQSLSRNMLCASLGALLTASMFTVDVSAQPPGGEGRRGGPPGGEGFGGPGRGGPGGPGGPGRSGQGGPGRGGAEMMMRLPVMAALDADRNGVISSEEIKNAAAALAKLDKNKDGELDVSELAPDFGGRGRGGPGGRGFADGDRGPGGRPEMQRGDRGGPGGAGRGGNPEEMVARLMKQDKDGDGLLTKEELPSFMSRMMERADTNGDSKLSKEEITSAMSTMRRGGAGGGGAGGRGDRGGSQETPGGEKPRRPAAE